MAVHKVPQDVEAEDKFLGPLTFKQFLFGGGVVITGYIMFLLVTKGAAFVAVFVLPFFLIFTALAFPWGKDQPTEIWLAARFRYMFFPRKRIWDQSGAKDLVTINVPIREEHIYSDGLEEDEVKNRFNVIADVVDSRGWAVKEASFVSAQNTTAQAQVATLPPPPPPPSDRLATQSIVQPTKDISAVDKAEDVFDNISSPLPDQFDSMIQQSEENRRKATLKMVNDALHSETTPSLPPVVDDPNHPGSDWFTNHQGQPQDPELLKIKKPNNRPNNTKKSQKGQSQSKFNPSGNNQIPSRSYTASINLNNANASSTTPVDPGILALVHNNDRSVESIEREAKKNNSEDKEVVIKLH